MQIIKFLSTFVWFAFILSSIPTLSPLKYLIPFILIFVLLVFPSGLFRYSYNHYLFSFLIFVLSLCSMFVAPFEINDLTGKSLITLFTTFLIVVVYPVIFNKISIFTHLAIYSRIFPILLYLSSFLAFTVPQYVTDSTTGSSIYGFKTSSFSGIFETTNSAGYLIALYLIFITSRQYKNRLELFWSIFPLLCYTVSGFKVALIPFSRTFLFLMLLILAINPVSRLLVSLSQLKLRLKYILLFLFTSLSLLLSLAIPFVSSKVLSLLKIDKEIYSATWQLSDYFLKSNRAPVFENAIDYLHNSGLLFFFGTGPSTEATVLTNHSAMGGGLHAHNTILSLLIEYGFIATSIILIYIGFNLSVHFFSCFSYYTSHNNLAIKILLLFLVISLQDSPFTSSAGILFMPFVLLIFTPILTHSQRKLVT